MRDGELIDYRVKAFKERWSKEKQDKIISFLEQLSHYRTVKHVAIKSPNPLKTSKRLDQLTIKVTSFFEKQKMILHYNSLPSVKLGLAIKSKNKDRFMEQI